MPRRAPNFPEKRHANLSAEQVKNAVPKLERRLAELRAVKIERWDKNVQNNLDALHLKIENTIAEIFPPDTYEYDRFKVQKFWLSVSMNVHGTPDHEFVEGYGEAVAAATSKLQTAVDLLQEKLHDMGVTPSGRALSAFQGLDLHPEIARRASGLYMDGHYANAVEAAVKALNALVRLRSAVDDLDGSKLMERVFSPGNPILKFNDLADQSAHDEQRGFMMLFSGAVAGLRNPRAHGFIQDDPERALEFIAFVSLLAKLLDGARGP